MKTNVWAVVLVAILLSCHKDHPNQTSVDSTDKEFVMRASMAIQPKWVRGRWVLLRQPTKTYRILAISWLLDMERLKRN